MSGVNSAPATPERQVIPSVFDHVWDLAKFAAEQQAAPAGTELHTMVLDFRDAFMSVPLAEAERPFNCCEIEVPLKRSRPPAYDGGA